MQVKVIEDAYVLVPNNEHQNFTKTEKLILKDTILDGEKKIVAGKRRGEPFNYRLFKTKDNDYIHLNKTNPMTNTEVYLGADAQQTPTLINIPAVKKLLTPTVVAVTLVGAGAGYLYSKKKGMDKKKIVMYSLVGGLVGFFGAKYFEKRKAIKIQPSK